VCAGQPDVQFVRMVNEKKGHKVVSLDGSLACYVDNVPVELDGVHYDQTVRTSGCQMLCESMKCSCCKSYRPTLHSMYHRAAKRSSHDFTNQSLYTNDRYLKISLKVSKIS
jgi:hypothetical protein